MPIQLDIDDFRIGTFNDYGIKTRLEELEASGSLNLFNVVDYGFVDGGAISQSAIDDLKGEVLLAGGGCIYYPSGTWNHPLVQGGATWDFQATGDTRVCFRGAGDSSILTWGGNAGGADSHFFRLREGVRHVDFERLWLMQKDLTNPNGAEQHFAIHLVSGLSGGADGGNIEHVGIHRVRFGVFKGDCVNLTGQIDWNACKASIAGTVAQGALSGPFNSPARPQRMAVKYPAAWDGGSFTIAGTSVHDEVISETLPAGVSDTAVGVLEFKTVTGITKNATGTTSNTANVGFAYEVRDITIAHCKMDGFDYAGTNPGYGYRACVVAQRLTRRINILHNYMRGSDDQVVDFEPTGNGDLVQWKIEHNTILAESPGLGHSNSLAVTLFGNGNNQTLGSLLLEDSSFSYNRVLGRVQGGKLRNVKIRGNTIVTDDNDSPPEGALTFTGTMHEVDIEDNKIVISRPGFLGKPIAIEPGDATLPTRGCNIRRNKVYWWSGAGITVKDFNDCEISGNTGYYLSSTTNTDDFIVTSAPLVNPSNYLRVRDNFVYGNHGGGTLRWALNLGGGTAAKGFEVTGNDGVGVQSRGVSLGGTYAEPPVVIGNGFAGATTPLNVPTGQAVIISGNSKDVTITQSDGGPEGVVTAICGSTHVHVNGSNTATYRKVTGTGNTGWEFAQGTTISPSSLGAGPTHNYAPTNVNSAECLRQDTSVAAVVTGLLVASASLGNGRKIIIQNISANNLTLNHEDTNSTAANRFTLPGAANLVITPGSAVALRYDGTSSRWRVAA